MYGFFQKYIRASYFGLMGQGLGYTAGEYLLKSNFKSIAHFANNNNISPSTLYGFIVGIAGMATFDSATSNDSFISYLTRIGVTGVAMGLNTLFQTLLEEIGFDSKMTMIISSFLLSHLCYKLDHICVDKQREQALLPVQRPR